MYCNFCGNKINGSDEYCSNCGNKVNMVKHEPAQNGFLVSSDFTGVKSMIYKHKEVALCICVALVLILGIVIISASCSNRMDELVLGEWETRNGGYTYSVIFNSDGTLIYKTNNGTRGPFNYSFSGSDLVITYNNGTSMTLKYTNDAASGNVTIVNGQQWYVDGDRLYLFRKTFYKRDSQF